MRKTGCAADPTAWAIEQAPPRICRRMSLYGGGRRGGGETGFEIVNMGRGTARAPVLAAGGIVLRQEETPLIAVVRLRKRNEWVLPKGKLDDGENAARRRRARGTGRNWT